jgi:hypothetical protein
VSICQSHLVSLSCAVIMEREREDGNNKATLTIANYSAVVKIKGSCQRCSMMTLFTFCVLSKFHVDAIHILCTFQVT